MTDQADSERDRPERRRWHVKKEVSLGDLVAIVSAILAVVYAYTTLDKRVSLLENTAGSQTSVDTRQDADALRYQTRIDDALRDINRKLDRLIEGRGR